MIMKQYDNLDKVTGRSDYMAMKLVPLEDVYPQSMDFAFQHLIISSMYDNDMVVI